MTELKHSKLWLAIRAGIELWTRRRRRTANIVSTIVVQGVPHPRTLWQLDDHYRRR